MRLSGVLAVVFYCLSVPGCGGDKAKPKGQNDTGNVPAVDSARQPTDLRIAEARAEVTPVDPTQTLMAMVDKQRYVADLTFIAQERPPESPHWQAVQDMCLQRFAELGFDATLHVFATGVNVIGVKEGSLLPDEQILVSAHYDHLVECEGADDNASGVAGTLELARVLSERVFQRTLVVACWDQEEWGMVGSKAYAKEAKVRGDDIKVSYVFEMIGYASSLPDSQEIPFGFDLIFPEDVQKLTDNEFRGDFIAVVADDLALPEAERLVEFGAGVDLPGITLVLTQTQKNSVLFHDLRRSDHSSFWDQDYPAMMITDTANFRNKNYHCTDGPDSVDRLDHDFATKVIQATSGAAANSLGML